MSENKIYQVSEKILRSEEINALQLEILIDHGYMKLIRNPINGETFVAFGEKYFLGIYGGNCFHLAFNPMHLGEASSSRELYLNDLESYLHSLVHDVKREYNRTNITSNTLPSVATALIIMHIKKACMYSSLSDELIIKHFDILEAFILYYLKLNDLPETLYTKCIQLPDKPAEEPVLTYDGISYYRMGIAYGDRFMPCRLTNETALMQSAFWVLDVTKIEKDDSLLQIAYSTPAVVALVYPHKGLYYYNCNAQDADIVALETGSINANTSCEIELHNRFDKDSFLYRKDLEGKHIKLSFHNNVVIVEVHERTYFIRIDSTLPFLLTETIYNIISSKGLPYTIRGDILSALNEFYPTHLEEDSLVYTQLKHETDWYSNEYKIPIWDFFYLYDDDEE